MNISDWHNWSGREDLNLRLPRPEPEANSLSMQFSSAQYMEFPQEKSDDSPVENQFGNPVIFLEGVACALL
jgi:hypothetical protein